MAETHTSGATGARTTWRDETHLRGVLWSLMTQYPDVTRDELLLKFLVKVAKLSNLKSLPPLVEEALHYRFDGLMRRRTRTPIVVSRKDIDADVAQIRAIVLMDMMMPNNKLLRFCTGQDCLGFSGWFVNIADRIGPRGVVGTRLTERDLIGILDAAMRKGKQAK